MRISKGQILALTLFVLLASLGTVLVLLMPINQQVIRIRKILNTFQALTFAESGLEVASLYSLKGKTLNNFLYNSTDPGGDVNQSPCAMFFNQLCSRSEMDECAHTKIQCIITTTTSDKIEAEMYNLELSSGLIYSYFIKLISTGKYKGLERVLDFDFLP